MALRNQPYIPLYVQDFLTDEKLNECSAESVGVYIMLMCVMHKSKEYGTILLRQKDRQNVNIVSDFAVKLTKHLPYDATTIERALTELLEEGVLNIDGSMLFQKRMVRDGKLSEMRSAAGKKGADTTNSKFFAAANQSANGAANMAANSENEVEVENETENEDAVETEKDQTEETLPSCPFEKIKQLYNSTCISFSKIKGIDGTRRTAVAARWKTYKSLDAFLELFKITEESNFLKGNNDRNWTATFDWLMKPNNFAKVLEHTYDNKGGAGQGGTNRGYTPQQPGGFKPSEGFQKE